MSLLARNYACPAGAFDLLMQDAAGALVAVEVRYRRDDSRGSATESVDGAKQQHITKAAQHFLKARPELRRRALRFDMVAETGSQGPGGGRIQDAFQIA